MKTFLAAAVMLAITGLVSQSVAQTRVPLSPSTGAVVGLAPKASVNDLDHAIAAAKQASSIWSKTPDAERRKLCHAVGAKIALLPIPAMLPKNSMSRS